MAQIKLPESEFSPTHLFEANKNHEFVVFPVNCTAWWQHEMTYPTSFRALVSVVNVEAAFEVDGTIKYLCRVQTEDEKELLVHSDNLALLVTTANEIQITEVDSGPSVTYPRNSQFALRTGSFLAQADNPKFLCGGMIQQEKSGVPRREGADNVWVNILSTDTNFQDQRSRVLECLPESHYSNCSGERVTKKIIKDFTSGSVSGRAGDSVYCLVSQKGPEGQTLVIHKGNTAWLSSSLFEQEAPQSKKPPEQKDEADIKRDYLARMKRKREGKAAGLPLEPALKIAPAPAPGIKNNLPADPVTPPVAPQVIIGQKPDDLSTIQKESIEPGLQNKPQQSAADVLAGTPLRVAIDDLRKILDQDKCKNSNILAALEQLENKLIDSLNQQTRLDAIRTFESTYATSLGTKLGQAAALVIVAGVGFALGVVIGEAIGIPAGAWDDISSAMLKIIEAFHGTITNAALVVLGGAALVSVVTPILTYQTFFKSTEAEKAAEEVVSESYKFEPSR